MQSFHIPRIPGSWLHSMVHKSAPQDFLNSINLVLRRATTFAWAAIYPPCCQPWLVQMKCTSTTDDYRRQPLKRSQHNNLDQTWARVPRRETCLNLNELNYFHYFATWPLKCGPGRLQRNSVENLFSGWLADDEAVLPAWITFSSNLWELNLGEQTAQTMTAKKWLMVNEFNLFGWDTVTN